MMYSLVNNTGKGRHMQNLWLAAFLIVGTVGAVNHATAEAPKPPSTSNAINVPAGNPAFLVGHATGTQGYTCLPTNDGGASWTVVPSRPEAILFTKTLGNNLEFITHFLSPDTNPNAAAPKPLPFGSATWQSSLDGSVVWAAKTGNVAAGSEVSCPNSGAIDCLRLESIGSLSGPAGGGLLTQTTFIQRLNTKGGSAPPQGCAVSADVGKQVLVPYSADYYFFHRNQ